MKSFKVALTAFAASVALASTLAAPTAEAVPLLTGFGGPTGYGLPQNCVHPNDDGSYAGGPTATAASPVPIDISAAFPSGINFFGSVYRSMYVNTNGNITFRAALPTYTPQAFPVSMQPMIAPWWGDVDTRGGGQPARNNICFHVERNRVVVTWNNVGYFSSHDNLQNDFQLVLTTSNTCATTGDFDVEFRYNRCQWTTGDASGGTGGYGGTPAQVGFDAGNRTNFVSLPMSRTMAILDVCRTSNVAGGAPGLWRFQIRGGSIAGGCSGGGTACTVAGQRGACANGINICSGMGVTCRQVNMPREERCNGFDDDCDGVADNGTNLCGRGFVCDRGSCVEQCSGELGCLTGRTCTDAGLCVETSCLDRSCPSGQRCSAGNCIDPCSGVTCPANQICRAGRCANPCEGVTCNPMEVCDRGTGLCVPGCQCNPCAAGQSCQPDGYCVADDCVGVTCPTGQYCRGGTCRDACETGPDTRLCPSGEMCQLGECVSVAAPRDAGADAARTDGSTGTDASRPADSATSRDATAGDGAASDDGEEPVFVSSRPVGCQCSTTGAAAPRGHALAALGFGLAVVLRRMRRTRR